MTLVQLKYAVAIADAGSMNGAAKELFIAQPSLSAAVKELETELGFDLFLRTNRGIRLTPEGQEFTGYARQVLEQFDLLESRFITDQKVKKHFAVSMQHYTFAVQAFVDTIREFGMDEYEFSVNEVQTAEVIENVKTFRSEIGVLYMNDFNSKVLLKLLKEDELLFVPLFDCSIYAYMWKGNPLAGRESVTLEDLSDYPCLSFDQGENNSFYFAEEVLSTYHYKKLIKAADRATLLNLMVGLNGYTLCSGIICEDLNGSDYVAVKLDSDEKMTIGYIMRKHTQLSEIGKKYVENLAKFRESVLK